jgi:integrase/recombinase XerD
MKEDQNFSRLLGMYFNQRLQDQFQASQHTIASYSHTFQLLLEYASIKLNKTPSRILLDEIDADFVSEFLDYLENERKVCASTRNTRLAAIRSFYKFLSYRTLEYGEIIQRVLAIPNKRKEQKLVDFLNEDELKALLAVPDQTTWMGKRDHTFLMLAINTGLRVSELLGLKWKDINLDQPFQIKCLGKGRKHRTLPLNDQMVGYLRQWLKKSKSSPSDFVFLTIHRKKMTAFPVRDFLTKYTKIASEVCFSFKNKRITPHVLRHTTAMRLLHAKMDLASIAIWLGHESLKTTYIYLAADTEANDNVLKKVPMIKTKGKWSAPNDEIMEILKRLSRGDSSEEGKKRKK